MELQEYLDKKYTKEQQLNLTELDCGLRELTSLKGIENLRNLKTLYCSGNKLISLKGIENLTSLTELYCEDNKLISLKGIENLTSLTELDCCNNKLTSLPVGELINLEYLYYKDNNLPTGYPDNLDDIRKYEYIKMIERKFNI